MPGTHAPQRESRSRADGGADRRVTPFSRTDVGTDRRVTSLSRGHIRPDVLLYGDRACFSDKVGGSGGDCVVKELLSCVGELYAVLGDKHERTLDSVAAVKHGRLGAFDTCHLDSLYTALTVYCGERSVADSVLVVLYCGDDRAGGGELLSELALVARLCYRLKAVSCARAGLAADAGDREVVAADLIPVGDLTGKDACYLLDGQILDLAVLINYDGDPVKRNGGRGKSRLAVLELSG